MNKVEVAVADATDQVAVEADLDELLWRLEEISVLRPESTAGGSPAPAAGPAANEIPSHCGWHGQRGGEGDE